MGEDGQSYGNACDGIVFFLIFAKTRKIMRIEFHCSPIEYADGLTKSQLKKVIKACKSGPYDEWTDRCRLCFEKYLEGDMVQARWWSLHAENVRP